MTTTTRKLAFAGYLTCNGSKNTDYELTVFKTFPKLALSVRQILEAKL